MRALQVTTHLNIGGIANYILTLSCALKRKGVDCVVASSGGNLEDEFKKHNITTRGLAIKTKNEFSPKVFIAVFNLIRMIKSEGIDIVHAHTRVSQVAAFFASRITGVPYVTTCHGFFKRGLRKIFDTWGSEVIAISDAVKTHLEKDLGVDAGRIEVIYNGVDMERLSKNYSRDEIEKIKKELGLKGGPLVGTISRLSPVKGHKTFIEAMRDILIKDRNVEGIIVGDGPEEMNLKRLMVELGIEDSFHFLKASSDTPKYLSVMDIFVFPSIKEGLGLSLLEAMARGLACIASRVGGISDIIKDGETGILFPVGDVKMLESSIVRLLGDEPLRRRLGEAARALASARFSSTIMADKVLDVYNKVLKSYAA